MLALIQRVTRASVTVEEKVTGQIGSGLLVLLGVEKDDDQNTADKLLNKVMAYRVFSDAEGKMNLNVQDAGGELLIVSQFTLAADTSRGLRPGFSSAKPPAEAQKLYEYFLQQARTGYDADKVAAGEFGADMQVSLINDGPVTFMLKA